MFRSTSFPLLIPFSSQLFFDFCAKIFHLLSKMRSLLFQSVIQNAITFVPPMDHFFRRGSAWQDGSRITRPYLARGKPLEPRICSALRFVAKKMRDVQRRAFRESRGFSLWQDASCAAFGSQLPSCHSNFFPNCGSLQKNFRLYLEHTLKKRDHIFDHN